MSRLFFILVVILVSKSYSVRKEYYWKDYNGVVPEDAIEGGFDKNGVSIYIAQAEVKGSAEREGVFVTSLNPNVSFITAPIPIYSPFDFKPMKIESNIKILCGSQHSAYWLQAKADNLHVVLIGKNPVQGGHLVNKSLHIGRIFYDNEIKIGPILSYELDVAKLLIIHEGRVEMTGNYEVLLYRTVLEHRRRLEPKRFNWKN